MAAAQKNFSNILFHRVLAVV